MKTQTHTPGPWTFNGMFQSRGDKMTYEIIGGAIKQDAVLMAAAPELLHAACFALDVLAINGDIENAKHWLRKAIQKAKGE